MLVNKSLRKGRALVRKTSSAPAVLGRAECSLSNLIIIRELVEDPPRASQLAASLSSARIESASAKPRPLELSKVSQN